jgi:hypothetical protein
MSQFTFTTIGFLVCKVVRKYNVTIVKAMEKFLLTLEFNEVAEGDLGKMRAEHFSVKFLLGVPTRIFIDRRENKNGGRAQRGAERSGASFQFS